MKKWLTSCIAANEAIAVHLCSKDAWRISRVEQQLKQLTSSLGVAEGDAEMMCTPASRSYLLEISLPVALVGAALLILVLVLCGHKQLFNDFKQWRIHILKSRWKLHK